MDKVTISSIQRQLAAALSQIPQDVWSEIVKKDPEWLELEPLRPKFLGGLFSVFMLTVGLNAYQLKGRAELNYWPQLYECLKDHESIPHVEILHDFLAEFYKKERLNAAKLERLTRFLQSPLAKRLSSQSPKDIASSINYEYDEDPMSWGKPMASMLR